MEVVFIFLTAIILSITVFVLVKGRPNLFIFKLIEKIFGEDSERKRE